MKDSRTIFGMMIIIFISTMLFNACGEDDDNNTLPTCSNGIQDGDETGVDCGGSCSPCTTQSCKATKHIQTWTGGSETHIWKYDSQNRVIKDSILSNPDLSWLINYAGSVINATTVSGGVSITVRLNANGFPIESDAFFQYTAVYKSDGTLQSARGVKDADETLILDSIMYADDNIVSYRLSDSTASGITSDTYTCTYYTDKDYTTPYNPVAKIYSLFGQYPGYVLPSTRPFDSFTPQPFSKKMLKSVSSTTLPQQNYSYEFDSNGKVTKTTTNLDETSYEYTCQ